MQFTASDGLVLRKEQIVIDLALIIKRLKEDGYITGLCYWDKEILECILNKNLLAKKTIPGKYYVELHKHITEDELEQIKQFKHFLEL